MRQVAMQTNLSLHWKWKLSYGAASTKVEAGNRQYW